MRLTTKKISKPCIIGPCEGNPSTTGGFPSPKKSQWYGRGVHCMTSWCSIIPQPLMPHHGTCPTHPCLAEVIHCLPVTWEYASRCSARQKTAPSQKHYCVNVWSLYLSFVPSLLSGLCSDWAMSWIPANCQTLIWPPAQSTHDDVIKWKQFPRNWPFVRGIHRSRWISRTKASDAELWCFLWSASE